MDEYFIGAGALLTAGPKASIAGATLHAQPAPELTGVEAALVDFEGTQACELSRILIVAAGWSVDRFRRQVVRDLVARGDCTLADVLATLAKGVGVADVHLFARWRPDEATTAALLERGVRLVAHPLETIGQAALVSGQRIERWRSAVRAA